MHIKGKSAVCQLSLSSTDKNTLRNGKSLSGNKTSITKNNFQKLAIVGLLFIGQAIAAPERLRRDAPLLPAWDVPNNGFEGRNDIFKAPINYELVNTEYGVPHDEYGPPHEEYGPPPVPHEEYGPPEVPATTEQ